MKLRRVRPDKIEIPETRVTAQFDPELYGMFKESIKAVGQIAPIICIEVEDKLYLADGLHRLVEAKNNHDEFVDVAVIPGSEVDVYTINLFLDHLRGKPKISDMRKVVEVLIKEYGLDSEKIAEKTFKSRDYIENIMAINELTPMALQALDDEKIRLGVAKELTRLTDPVAQETVLMAAIQYNYTVKDVKQLVDMTLEAKMQLGQPPVPVVAQPRPGVGCAYCGKEYDPAIVKMVITCPGCFIYAYDVIRASIREIQQVPNATGEGTKVPE